MVPQQRERLPALRAAVPAALEIPDHLNPGQMRVITPPCPRPRTPLLVTAAARTALQLPAAAGITITGIRPRARVRPLRGPPEQHPLENRQVSPEILQLGRQFGVLRPQPGVLLAQLRRQPRHLLIRFQRSSQHVPKRYLQPPPNPEPRQPQPPHSTANTLSSRKSRSRESFQTGKGATEGEGEYDVAGLSGLTKPHAVCARFRL